MQNPPSVEHLNEQVRRTLLAYDERLLRQVAQKLCKPRNQWPVAELVERIVAALSNAPVLDRRLKDLPAACQQLLALLSHSRQVRWPAGTLVELLVTLGHDDGLAPIKTLLEAGLLLPDFPSPLPLGERGAGEGAAHSETSTPSPPTPLPPGERGEKKAPRFRSFEVWLAGASPPILFMPPLVAERALNVNLELPACPGASTSPQPGQEADGLEWPLRLAALWQQVHNAPLRRTQQKDFFKRDLDRLRADPLLSTPPGDALVELPDPGLFTVALALASGLLREEDAELRAEDVDPSWSEPLPTLLAELWTSLSWLHGWNPSDGWQQGGALGNPYPSAQLVAMLFLSQLSEKTWASPTAIDAWLRERHPYWKGRKGSIGIDTFLLGVAYPLRLLQACKDNSGHWLVRLSALGRWLLKLGDAPAASPAYPQTLLVQPNLEILAYRQGLTPSLIVTLGRCATWKGLSPACTLQLEPASVYRALESGETLSSIVQTLERHGMKALPPAVLDSLRTWADKRERLTIFTSAALFEFASAAEMTEALARGLPALQLTDRLAVVANEKDIDYRHFRLTGTRDYCLPPDKCVDVESDGVTLNIDLAKSDLLLETEVQRFAGLAPQQGAPGRRLYRLTPASIAVARDKGVSLGYVEQWFERRSGQPISPAARLVLTGPETAPLELRRQLVLHVSAPAVADGLQEWPGTRTLIQARLGPTALVVDEADVPALLARLEELGVAILSSRLAIP